MSEFQHSQSDLSVENIERFSQVECEFEHKDDLMSKYQKGETLLFSFNPENYDIKIWFRANNTDVNRFHNVVDSDAFNDGLCGAFDNKRAYNLRGGRQWMKK